MATQALLLKQQLPLLVVCSSRRVRPCGGYVIVATVLAEAASSSGELRELQDGAVFLLLAIAFTVAAVAIIHVEIINSSASPIHNG